MGLILNFNVAEFRRRVAEIRQSHAVRNSIYELLRFSLENADRITGGKAELGSFHYQISVKNRVPTLFTSDASGYISVSLGGFVSGVPLVPGRLVANLRSTLANIPGFESFSKNYPFKPGFLITRTVVDPNVMGSFQKAILKFQNDAQAS